MTQAMSRGECCPLFSVFVDDTSTGGDLEDDAWENTLKALIKLAEAGFPISIKKCEFLVVTLNYLGMVMAEKRYSLGKKSL
jgi:hypothetical protein